jgi:hypothetical protein
MAMRCPNCSNELSSDEAFCGLCGTPIIPSAQPTAMVNPPPTRQGLLSGGYNTTISSSPGTNRSGMQPPPDNQSATRSPGPQQQGGFYRDPTEAMPALPSNQVQNYPTVYPQQGYTGAPMPGGYSGVGQYAPQMQPFQSGNYTGTIYPTGQQFSTGQGYGMPPGFTPPPPKQRNNLALIIASICLVLAIITIGAFGTVYLFAITLQTKHKLRIKMPPLPVFQLLRRYPAPVLHLHLHLLQHLRRLQHLHLHQRPTQVSPCAILPVRPTASL